jgi:Coenzyme PQQ synthesis protein D (PqqD)
VTSRSVRLAEGVAHRAFGEQVLLLNLATGQYHGLNATARIMLEALIERGETEGVAAELAATHRWPEAEVAADLAELCESLEARGLIEIAPLGAPDRTSEEDPSG